MPPLEVDKGRQERRDTACLFRVVGVGAAIRQSEEDAASAVIVHVVEPVAADTVSPEADQKIAGPGSLQEYLDVRLRQKRFLLRNRGTPEQLSRKDLNQVAGIGTTANGMPNADSNPR